MPPSGPEANWHSLVSTSVTLSAACEVGTEQQSQAFGNICGQLRGEEGAKERNLLLINKIMGAIRPFSHHYCLQSLSHSLPFFPSLCLTHSISLFSAKKCIPFFKNEVKERVWEKERKKIWGQGRAWSSNQQLTGVRMFMGRVSFKRLVLFQFSCGLTVSSSLILKLCREKKNSFSAGKFCFFFCFVFLHRKKSIFLPKSKKFLLCNWIVESFSVFFSPVAKSSSLISQQVLENIFSPEHSVICAPE